MADVREVRRLTLVLLVLLCIDLVCAAVLLSPIRRSAPARQAELKQLWNELQAKTRDSVPLQGIEGKVTQASKEIADFYSERFPFSYSEITDNLGKCASKENIKVTSVRYQGSEAEAPNLERVAITATIEGNYLQEVKFINALERDKMFFIINSVALGGQKDGKAHLDLQLETYRKTKS
ncbi:MAG: hypothetical protein ACE14M_07510 [Terriglobales bacterium]